MTRLRLALFAAAGFVLFADCDNSTSSDKKNASGGGTLTEGSTIKGSFTQRNTLYDTARITFQADSGYTYAIQIQGELFTEQSILAPSGATASFLSTYSRSDDWQDSLSMPCYKSGTYTLVVYGPSGSEFVVHMAAKTKGVPGGVVVEDSYESDNVLGAAKSIATDSTVQNRTIHGSSSSHGDIDWIWLKCDSGKTYTFHYSDTSGDMSLSVYDSDTEYVSSSYGSNSVSGKTIYYRKISVAKSGAYFLRFSNSYQAGHYSVAATVKNGLEGWSSPDAYEADNTIGAAKSIATDSTVQNRTIHGNPSSHDDVDWISMKCDSGKTYTFYYTDSSSDMSLSVYDSDTDAVSSTYGSTTVSGKTVYFRKLGIVESGTYYLRFSNSYEAGHYSVAVTAKAGFEGPGYPDTYESDNTRAAAKTIVADSSVQNRTLHGAYTTSSTSSDVDWIAIQCDSGMEYRVDIRDDEEDASPFVYDADSAGVSTTSSYKYSSSLGMYVYSYAFYAERKGTYHVRIVSDYYAVNYWLAVTKRKPTSVIGADAFEGDNGIAAAKSIATDSTVQNRTIHGTVASHGDVDWIAVDCDTGKTYSIWYRDSLDDLSVYLYNGDSTNQSLNTTSSYSSALGMYVYRSKFTATKPGKHYVRVHNAYEAEAYQIAVTVVDGIVGRFATDGFETDDGLHAAKKLPTDSSVQHRTLHGTASVHTDVDWLAIECDTGKTYTIWFRDTLDDVNAYIYTPDSTTLTTTLYSSYSSKHGMYVYRRSFSVAIPTTYYVRVTNSYEACDYFVAATVEDGVAGRYPADTFEADDGLSTAKSIGTDSSVQKRTLHGSNGSSSDVDWISFKCDSGMVYRLYYRDIDGRAATGFYDADSSVVSSTLSSSYSSDASGYIYNRTFIATKNGVYYAKVSSSYAITYYAAVRESWPAGYAPADTFEVDDTQAEAKPISTDSTVQNRTIHGSAASHSDVDWISLECDSGKAYTVSYRDIEDDIVVSVYNSDDFSLSATSTYSWVSSLGMYINRRTFTAAKSGKYFIRVYNNYEAVPYFIAVSAAK